MFGGIYSFATIEFDTRDPSEYEIYVFNGSTYDLIAKGISDDSDYRIKANPAEGCCQIKSTTTSMRNAGRRRWIEKSGFSECRIRKNSTSPVCGLVYQSPKRCFPAMKLFRCTRSFYDNDRINCAGDQYCCYGNESDRLSAEKAKNVMIFQLLGALLFGINFFLLEAWVGGLLSAVAIIRALVFLQRERLHAEHPAWFFGFSAMSVLSYILSFTVLGTPLKISNLIVELLPVIGVIAVNYSYRLKEAKDIRRYGLINSPLWLVYNVWNFSLGTICCESLSLISIGVGILRLDLKRTQKESDGKKPV